MSLIETWRVLNSTFRIGLAAIALVALVIATNKLRCDPKPGGVERQTSTAVGVEPAPVAIVHPSAPPVPAPERRKIRGTLTVHVSPDSSSGWAPSTITVLVPSDPGSPPLVSTDGPAIVRATYSPARSPLLSWGTRASIGASVDQSIGRLSPLATLGLLRVRGRLSLGISGSREGVGPSASVMVWREWEIVGTRALLRPASAGGPWSIGLSYRL